MVLLTHPEQGTQNTHQEGGKEHEEYDGSKRYADVLHVLYVFDMFEFKTINLLVINNNLFM